MPEQYIVAQTADSKHPLVMKREQVDDREVYVPLTGGFLSVAVAGQVADALNAQQEVAVAEVDAEGLRPLYAGSQPIGGSTGEVDIAKTVRQVYDGGNPSLAFALAEANGYDFRPALWHHIGDFECKARDNSRDAGMKGVRCLVCRPIPADTEEVSDAEGAGE